jgi:putative aldouronate transport system substrate-binding protein
MSSEKENSLSDKLLNRRQFMHTTAIVAGGSLLAACGGSTPTKPVPVVAIPTIPPAVATATVSAMVGKTYFPSGNPDLVPDAFTAPLPLTQSVHFVPGRGDPVSVFQLTNNPPVKAKEQNAYWQELEKRLNVTWNVSFAPGSNVYTERIATLLASGDLPDLVRIETANAPLTAGIAARRIYRTLALSDRQCPQRLP